MLKIKIFVRGSGPSPKTIRLVFYRNNKNRGIKLYLGYGEYSLGRLPAVFLESRAIRDFSNEAVR